MTRTEAGLVCISTHCRGKQTRLLFVLMVILTAACGKKGPPLAPFVRVPAAVGEVTVRRMGDDVFVSFPVPSADADGQQPADLASLEVYAITATSPPETDEHRKLATLITTLPVRPIMPALPPAAAGVEVATLPMPPGIDRAAPAVVRETLAAEQRVPVVLPARKGVKPAEVSADEEMVIGPLVAPAPAQLPRRYYFVVGVSGRGRKAQPSAAVAVPLDAASSAPGAPSVAFTETDMTIKWAPSKDARIAAFAEPPAPVAVAPAIAPPANASPTDVSPANASPANVPPPLPAIAPLVAKSLGFQSEATTYHLFEVPSTPAPDNPFAITVPVPLTPLPLASTEHSIKGVTFGTERCFVVRPVERIAGAVVMGPESPRTCVTPADTFPPAAPRSLAAIAGDGVISLIWEANSDTDLAGYLVLRGDAPGDTLRAITPEPVAATTFRDTKTRAGARYVYVVVAVDRATPQNVSAQSNRVEETAR